MEIVFLYDFYSELLTQKQRKFFELYYHENLSQNEIAELLNISHQAVADLISRTENKLLEYEKKLCLYKKYIDQKEKINEICEIIEQLSLDLEEGYGDGEPDYAGFKSRADSASSYSLNLHFNKRFTTLRHLVLDLLL